MDYQPPTFPMQYPGNTPLRPPNMPPEPPPPPPPYQPNADELSRLVELGVLSQEEAENMRQQKRMEEASTAGPPEGRMVGRVYVAASPFEHLASAAVRTGSAMRLAQLRKDREMLMNRQRAGLRAEQDIGQQTLGYPAPFGF